MLERFQGREGRAALLQALRSQFLVDGSSELADLIASASQVREFAPGSTLFAQGERSSDLYFILAGQVSVRVDDRDIATCSAGIHVGEIALLDPFKGRSATVVAVDTVVVAQISAQKFTDIAKHHPELWRRIAIELARRLVKTQSKG
jgi:CRP/FNR family cyclic AMP-dependent transcriptional regulator